VSISAQRACRGGVDRRQWTSVGQYQVEDLLGAGGMGEVYRARDRRSAATSRSLLPPGFTTDATGWPGSAEAQILAALNHPNICAIWRIGRSRWNQVLVLAVEGRTLRIALPRPGEESAANRAAAGRDVGGRAADRRGTRSRARQRHHPLDWPANVKITSDGVVMH
jgi:hypothetical protein